MGQPAFMAANDQVFTRRTVAWLILIGGAASCGILVLALAIDPADRDVTAPSSYSRSALGHAAFVALLRETGYRVQVNRGRRGVGIAERDALLLLEPDLRLNANQDLIRLVKGKRRVLLTLPKWRVEASLVPSAATAQGWIDGASRLPTDAAAKVARAAIIFADIARTEVNGPWNDQLGHGPPTIGETQLLKGTHLQPLVATADGILAGEMSHADDGRILVLADPDLMANHGLHRGANAAMALAIVDRLLEGERDVTIHVDESLHGFAIVPSLPRLLFAPPFLAATLLALAAVAAIVWRATVRFGTPPTTDAIPVFGSGHETLLHNAGRLLASADHGPNIAERYAAATLEEAARRLHLRPPRGRAPAGAREDPKQPDLRGMLASIARRRGVRVRLPSGETQRPLAKARRYYDWMEEMFGGTRSHRDTR